MKRMEASVAGGVPGGESVRGEMTGVVSKVTGPDPLGLAGHCKD